MPVPQAVKASAEAATTTQGLICCHFIFMMVSR